MTAVNAALTDLIAKAPVLGNSCGPLVFQRYFRRGGPASHPAGGRVG